MTRVPADQRSPTSKHSKRVAAQATHRQLPNYFRKVSHHDWALSSFITSTVSFMADCRRWVRSLRSIVQCTARCCPKDQVRRANTLLESYKFVSSFFDDLTQFKVVLHGHWSFCAPPSARKAHLRLWTPAPVGSWWTEWNHHRLKEMLDHLVGMHSICRSPFLHSLIGLDPSGSTCLDLGTWALPMHL
jgi:hypothetical protein